MMVQRIPQRHRRERHDEVDGAVSSVLGAILVFGLLVVTLTTVQTQFVPVWEKQREARHMQDVANQFALIKSDLDRMAGNRTQGDLTQTVTLGTRQGFAFFRSTNLPGSLEFSPSGGGSSGLQVSSPRLTVVESNGQGTFSQGEQWRSVTTDQTLTFVTEMLHMRLNVTPPAARPIPQSTLGYLELRVTDRDGAAAGRFRLDHEANQDDYFIDMAVFSRNNDVVPIYTHREIWDRQNPPDHFFVNMLQQDLLFRDVLRSAPGPFTVTMTRSGIDATFTATYRVEVPGGGTGVSGGGGLVLPDFTTAGPSGSLSMQKDNSNYVAQERIIEHGGFLLQQSGTTVMLVGPAFHAAGSGTQLSVDLSIPALAGDGNAIAGREAASVQLRPSASLVDVAATAATFSLRLPTDHGLAWTTYWGDVMAAAGVPASQYGLTSDAGSATLTLLGPSSDPLVDDLSLTLRITPVQIDLGRAG